MYTPQRLHTKDTKEQRSQRRIKELLSVIYACSYTYKFSNNNTLIFLCILFFLRVLGVNYSEKNA